MAPGVWGIWGEWLFLFRELEGTGNYFRGSGEQVHSFGDFGSPPRKKNIKNIILKEKLPFCLIIKKTLACGGKTPPPPFNCNCLFTCTSAFIGEKKNPIIFVVVVVVYLFIIL